MSSEVATGRRMNGRQLLPLVAVVGLDHQLLALAQLFLDFRQSVFLGTEGNGNGLKLGNHRQGLVSVAWTMLPGSTKRSPTWPEMGAVMWQ
jgi:hypothetical protein